MVREEQKRLIAELLDVVEEFRCTLRNGNVIVLQALNYLHGLEDCMNHMDCESFVNMEALKRDIIRHYILNNGYNDIHEKLMCSLKVVGSVLEEADFGVADSLRYMYSSFSDAMRYLECLVTTADCIKEVYNILKQIKYVLECQDKRIDNILIVEYIN